MTCCVSAAFVGGEIGIKTSPGGKTFDVSLNPSHRRYPSPLSADLSVAETKPAIDAAYVAAKGTGPRNRQGRAAGAAQAILRLMGRGQSLTIAGRHPDRRNGASRCQRPRAKFSLWCELIECCGRGRVISGSYGRCQFLAISRTKRLSVTQASLLAVVQLQSRPVNLSPYAMYRV